MPFTQSHFDQTLAPQRTEAAGQGFHGDILIACEVALRYFATLMQRFQNQKLRKSQPARSQYEVVEVGYCTARAAKRSASARQKRALVLIGCIGNEVTRYDRGAHFLIVCRVLGSRKRHETPALV